MDPTLLSILVCPATHVPVRLLDGERLIALNRAIEKGRVRDVGGNDVTGALSEALITEDDRTVYRVDDDIPIMLIESGIDTEQLGW